VHSHIGKCVDFVFKNASYLLKLTDSAGIQIIKGLQMGDFLVFLIIFSD